MQHDLLNQHLRTLADDSASDYSKGVALEALLDATGTVWGRWTRTLGPDARQEAAIIIWEAARSYDPTRPALPFARAVIARRLSSLYVRSQATRRRPDLPILELGRPAIGNTKACGQDGSEALIDYLEDDHQYAASEDVERRDEVGTVWRKLVPELSQLERRSVVGRAKGYSFEEIALILGKSVKQIGNAVERVKAKWGHPIQEKYGPRMTVARYVYERRLVDGTSNYSVKIAQNRSRPKTILAGPFRTVEEAVAARDQLLREERAAG